MKKRFLNLVGLSLGVAIIASSGCKKDDDHHNHSDDTEAPKITINSPSQDEYEPGDTVWMDVLVTDNEDLHEVKWWLIKLPTDTVYANKRHQHAKEIHIKDTYYVIPDGTDADFKFSVKAEDDNENIATKSHSFHVH